MMDILKSRNTDLDELARIQRKVSEKVIREDKIDELETIAGCDVSFSEEGRAYAACVVMDYRTLDKLDENVVKVKVDFPYIPTFLSFRELEPMLRAVEKIEADLYMIDSQGLAHPRRAGLASHLGVVMDEPTIGVAKSRLCGDAEEPQAAKGSHTPLLDQGETIGAVVRTRKDVNPVYVSVGHKISLERAIEVVLKVSPKYKIPEPTRAAHRAATRAMKEH